MLRGRLLNHEACVLEVKPGKFDMKRRQPGILSISSHVQVGSLFKLAIYDQNPLRIKL